MDNFRQSRRSRIAPDSKLSRSNQLIFYHDPASLQKLSAVHVASQLWRHEISKYDIHARPLKPGLPLAKSLPDISKQLEKMIDRCIEPIRLSLLLWLKTHFFLIFLPYEKEYDILKKYFDCITWQADCSIDYDATADKLIACVELGAICKYKVACTYCLEDSVREFWNELPPDYHTLSDIWYVANYLVRYWDCRMKVDGGGSMSVQLFDKLQPETWSAWKYCWSRLPPNQRIDKAAAMIESKLGMKKYVKNLLPLLTKLELVKILPKCTKSIVTVLATSPENVTYALQTWQFVKNFTTRDSFVKMFEDVLASDLDVNTQQLTTVVQNNSQQNSLKFFDVTHMMNVSVSSLLYEIWQSSPDHLKTHLIDNHVAKILEKLSRIDNLFTLNSLCRDVRLMIELLSRRDTLVNNTFWRKNWTSLVKGVKSTHLDQIMKLCFRNEKDTAKFKKTHMIFSKIESYCGELICEGYFDELNDFLNFCTADQTVIVNWKRTILTNTINKFRFCVFYSDDKMKMQSFDEFIAHIYPDPERRRTFKCHMITSATNFEYLQNCVANGFLIPIKNFVNLFLTNDAEMKAVKKELKQQCHRILSKGKFGSFDVQSWNEFLLWCLDEDHRKLDEFKESLSVNDIYQIVFPECVQDIASRLTKKKTFVEDCIVELNKDEKDQPKNKENEENKENKEYSPAVHEAMKGLAWDKYDFIDDYFDGFEKFDNFLLWFFGSTDKANEFKLARFKKRGVLRSINQIKNSRLFLIVLHWCFNRDVQQIENFTRSVDS